MQIEVVVCDVCFIFPFESLHSSNKDNSDSNPISLNLSIVAKAQLDLRGWVKQLCMSEYGKTVTKCFVAVSASQKYKWSGFSLNLLVFAGYYCPVCNV